jgi:hypothetical protein
MKTKLFIALLLISTITFAQKKTKNQITKKTSRYMKIDDIKGESNDKTSRYMKIDDIKGESNDKSMKRTIKIGGAEKPYARTKGETTLGDIQVKSQKSSKPTSYMKIDDIKGESNDKSTKRIYNKRKFSSQPLKEKSMNQRTKGETTLGDIQIVNKNKEAAINKYKTRRRVVVAKSN